MNQLIQPGTIEIDLSGYHSGVYLCRFVNDNGDAFSKRIIID